jgi:hypothetical protein
MKTIEVSAWTIEAQAKTKPASWLGMNLSAQKTALTATKWISAWALALSVGLWSGSSEAQEQDIEWFYETTLLSFDEMRSSEMANLLPQESNRSEFRAKNGRARIVLDVVRMLGEGLWHLIENTGAINIAEPAVTHALPEGINEPWMLENWSNPRRATFQTDFVNSLGFIAVRSTYAVFYTPGGSYHGQGQYIANALVQLQDFWVAPTYSYNQRSRALTAVNLGSRVDPIAGLQILNEWTSGFVNFNPVMGSDCIFISGDPDRAPMRCE